MDKNTDRETRDFMNVESFSQLPFIRPNPQAAAAAKAGAPGGGAIRLFGKEFGADNNNNNNTGDHTPDSSQENNNSINNINGNNTMSSTTEMSSRRFECHYCCRNFPTSQALGGHQNAHKRERQQAKRAHLQSAMVHGANAAHVYGFMNYSTRLGSGSGSGSALPMAYHSWNSNNSSSSSSRFYGGSYHQPPINGSPLALWRIPAAAAHHGSPAGYNRERHTPMHQQMTPLELKQTIGSSNSNAQFRLGYESKAEMQDRVSLDLHL